SRVSPDGIERGGPLADVTYALPSVESFQNTAGKGVSGIVDGLPVLVGTDALMRDWAIASNPEAAESKQRLEAAGKTVVLVAWDGRVRGVVAVADSVKPTSAEAIE